ncbi:uncharacterized protein LOC142467290 isoform X3 [Ascaphus truei]|uniref:uncharacterized protein LOC142467290 isoform X3 n=1 Tax=Ascaphus truei TaxID=8439 RepID=UPI003F5A5DA2
MDGKPRKMSKKAADSSVWKSEHSEGQKYKVNNHMFSANKGILLPQRKDNPLLNSDICPRIKKEEEMDCRPYAVTCSQGNPVILPEVFVRIKKEDYSNLYGSVKEETRNAHIKGGLVFNPDTLLWIKQVDDPEITRHKDSQTQGKPDITSAFLTIKNEEDTDVPDIPDSGSGGNKTFDTMAVHGSPLAKEEEDIYCKEYNVVSNQPEVLYTQSIEKILSEERAIYKPVDGGSKQAQDSPSEFTIKTAPENETGFCILVDPIIPQGAKPDERYICPEFMDKPRLYECQECGRCFRTFERLKIHKRTHTGERPYSCNECDRSFSQQYNLITHLRTHTGERPYNCKECKKSFTQVSNLIQHRRTHTGEKPYKCPDCEKCFSQSTNLMKHKKTHKRAQDGKTNTAHPPDQIPD